MSENPCVLIVSSSSTRPKSLIKLLSKSPNIPDDHESPHRLCYSWKIDTKYYIAHVDLIGITEEYQRSETFNDSVEALIIHMDSNKESGLEDLAKWDSILEDCDPDIKLLVANYCTDDTKITRAEATKWCLLRGFELVELYPNIEDTETEEKTGVERIIEALGTHTWSNLIMKKQSDVGTQQFMEDIAGDLLEVENGDDFSDLFAELSVMKESLQSLPVNQRRQCAEQVVTAFWKAIGGDQDEIADL